MIVGGRAPIAGARALIAGGLDQDLALIDGAQGQIGTGRLTAAGGMGRRRGVGDGEIVGDGSEWADGMGRTIVHDHDRPGRTGGAHQTATGADMMDTVAAAQTAGVVAEVVDGAPRVAAAAAAAAAGGRGRTTAEVAPARMVEADQAMEAPAVGGIMAAAAAARPPRGRMVVDGTAVVVATAGMVVALLDHRARAPLRVGLHTAAEGMGAEDTRVRIRGAINLVSVCVCGYGFRCGCS